MDLHLHQPGVVSGHALLALVEALMHLVEPALYSLGQIVERLSETLDFASYFCGSAHDAARDGDNDATDSEYARDYGESGYDDLRRSHWIGG